MGAAGSSKRVVVQDLALVRFDSRRQQLWWGNKGQKQVTWKYSVKKSEFKLLSFIHIERAVSRVTPVILVT